MTEPQDPLKIIAAAAAKRAEAEAVLKKWIPAAYQSGVPILRIAKAAGITRAAVYGRLETAGVASTVVKANRWRPGGYHGRVEVDGPEVTDPGPGEALEELDGLGGWTEPEPVDDGRHPFEAAWSEAGEPLMVCKHCNLRAENGAHR